MPERCLSCRVNNSHSCKERTHGTESVPELYIVDSGRISKDKQEYRPEHHNDYAKGEHSYRTFGKQSTCMFGNECDEPPVVAPLFLRDQMFKKAEYDRGQGCQREA